MKQQISLRCRPSCSLLQERELERVAAPDHQSGCAGHRHHQSRSSQASERKEFRQDLFFRLNVVPSRSRRARAQGRRFNWRQFMPPKPAFAAGGGKHGRDDARYLGRGGVHSWRGNVRELQNVIERRGHSLAARRRRADGK